jgi:hypothetical protein
MDTLLATNTSNYPVISAVGAEYSVSSTTFGTTYNLSLASAYNRQTISEVYFIQYSTMTYGYYANEREAISASYFSLILRSNG